MSPTDIPALRKLMAELAPAPWRATDYHIEPKGSKGIACGGWECFVVSPGVMINEDAEAVATIRNALPALLAELEDALAEIERLKSIVDKPNGQVS